jgi:hypothetical protein
MTVINCNEAQFELPANWEDQSVLAFASPGEAPRNAVVITKQLLPEGKTAEELVDFHVQSLSQKLRRFQLIGKAAVKVGELPAWDIRFSFTHHGLAMYQRQVSVHWYDLLWVLSTSGGESRKDAIEHASDAILRSIKFRRKQGI